MVTGAATALAEETANALVLLAANEGNVTKTARELDITPGRLRKLRSSNQALYDAVCREIAAGILDKTLYITDKYLDEIARRADDGELTEMKTKDLMVTAAIGVDKINVMTAVRTKLGDAQKKAQDFGALTDEELDAAIEAEYKVLPETPQAEEPATDEGMSDPSENQLSAGPGGVSAAGPVLHRGGDTE